MKMIIAILRDSDADNVTQALTVDNFRVTRIASTGGWLRRGVVTLLVGVEDDRVEVAIQVMRAKTAPSDSDETQTTVFVVPVENYTQI
ncbi:MAG: hypothetical protein A2X25_05910 [Chloroflexi bacterium GWB2_49_20]|nr:MAG: hypothetical protein A2X25_05910 [Chloroflexi bacterium GWB2_49_20]OGN77156.1 MAG: hypothetical protein A2X26_06910 [Chloroflexi bacterium GWC2_49_37]OGN83882.1 MAG: hypothetical protein A2X27_02515 [Chloroflexi bacterium GWD2_49_16]